VGCGDVVVGAGGSTQLGSGATRRAILAGSGDSGPLLRFVMCRSPGAFLLCSAVKDAI